MIDVELVSMPVPRPLLPAVTALINDFYNPGSAGPAAADPKPSEAESSTAVEVPYNGWWDRARVGALLDDWHNADGRALLEVIAKRTLDGRPATSWGELQELSGQAAGKARSNLGALSKQAIKSVGAKEWPMHCTDLGNAVPSDDRYVYRMPTEVAEWVLEVLA